MILKYERLSFVVVSFYTLVYNCISGRGNNQKRVYAKKKCIKMRLPNQAVLWSSKHIFRYISSSVGSDNTACTRFATQKSVFSWGIPPGPSWFIWCVICRSQHVMQNTNLQTLQKDTSGDAFLHCTQQT